MFSPFGGTQGRAHRVLVVIRWAWVGLATPLAAATQWRTWRRKEFVARGMRAAQGKLFSLEGCGQEARGVSRAHARIHNKQGRDGSDHAISREGGEDRGWLGMPCAQRLRRHRSQSCAQRRDVGESRPQWRGQRNAPAASRGAAGSFGVAWKKLSQMTERCAPTKVNHAPTVDCGHSCLAGRGRGRPRHAQPDLDASASPGLTVTPGALLHAAGRSASAR